MRVIVESVDGAGIQHKKLGHLYYYSRIYRQAIVSYDGHLVEEDFKSVKLTEPLKYLHFQAYRLNDAIKRI